MSRAAVERGPARGIRRRDRAGAWIVTGPVGRVAAFLLLFAGALGRAVLRRRGRPA